MQVDEGESKKKRRGGGCIFPAQRARDRVPLQVRLEEKFSIRTTVARGFVREGATFYTLQQPKHRSVG